MHRLKTSPTVIGTKQTIRALNNGNVGTVYIANDADKQVVLRVKELAEANSIAIVEVTTMKELAKACNVEVNTATAALINVQEVK